MFHSVLLDQADCHNWHKVTDFSLLSLFQEPKKIVPLGLATLGLFKHQLNEDLVGAFIAKES